MLNKTDLAAPLGVSVPTIGQWLSVLETTGQVLVIPPFYENLGKRLVKSPKVHFADSGLACHLLGITSESELRRSPFLGALFEGFVAAEIAKLQVNAGRRQEIYYFRDQQGLEVDLVLPAGGRRLLLVEAKASRTVTPRMAEPLARLRRAADGYDVSSLVVHQGRAGESAGRRTTAVRPGVRAVSVQALHDVLSSKSVRD
jgi:predicted AAA+ superfamily ATPase